MKTPFTPCLSAIVAMSDNRVIGIDNQLPWYLPADLSHFKTITSGHPIIMGRKTYASIGRPLPRRTNIILTRQTGFSAPGCLVVNTLDEALLVAEGEGAKELFIIGGADIYKQTLAKVQRLYLTIVHHVFEGDAFFPPLVDGEWREVERSDYPEDENNVYSLSFIRLDRV